MVEMYRNTSTNIKVHLILVKSGLNYFFVTQQYMHIHNMTYQQCMTTQLQQDKIS